MAQAPPGSQPSPPRPPQPQSAAALIASARRQQQSFDERAQPGTSGASIKHGASEASAAGGARRKSNGPGGGADAGGGECLASLAAGMRFKRRLPTLSWLHPHSGGSLSRSSQPHGVLSAKEGQRADAAWLRNIYRTADVGRAAAAGGGAGSGATKLLVIDCRSRAAATANTLKGGGTESSRRLSAEVGVPAQIRFMSIANIHEMRGSLKKLAGAVSDESSSTGGGGGDAGADWLRALAGSAWLSHCAELLAASCLVADRLHCGAPVLVHCSDGWDRTSQIVATVQLLCDPHFRTLRGFGDLVEKDWCAFGHMFEVRGGGLHVATSGGSGAARRRRCRTTTPRPSTRRRPSFCSGSRWCGS
jgi:hypothetical protein